MRLAAASTAATFNPSPIFTALRAQNPALASTFLADQISALQTQIALRDQNFALEAQLAVRSARHHRTN